MFDDEYEIWWGDEDELEFEEGEIEEPTFEDFLTLLEDCYYSELEEHLDCFEDEGAF